MVIKSKISIPVINDLYTALEDARGNNRIENLQLPLKFDNTDFSVLFSFLQFVATWVRYSNSGSLILPINNPEDATLYFENEFAYPTIALSWENQIINEQEVNLRPYLVDVSLNYFQKMELFNLHDKLSVPIYCFDHDRRKTGHSKNFYDLSQKIYNEEVIGYNLTPAFKKIGDFNKRVFRENIKAHLDDFSTIIHELFCNTDEHAKTDEKGFNLYPNTRSVYLKFHKRRLDTYLSTYKNYPGLIEYFRSEGFSLNEQGELYLLEISLLDSGPGLAKRFTGKSQLNFSLEREVSIVKQCLYRHNSSSSIANIYKKGIGLDRVLQTIDGKGFVRIKSGRVDIFRNMRRYRYHHHHSYNEIQLSDWETNETENFTEHPFSEGTLISIFYPLDFEI